MRARAMLGGYRVLERLASGGMAEIYVAEQVGDRGITRTVALKTVLPQYLEDPSVRTMMLDEARTGFRLRHRNIVQVLDVGRDDDVLYIAMELIPGVNLAELVSNSSDDPMPPELVAYIGTEVLAALDYAHTLREDGKALGVVHRDISPQNVLISSSGEIKVTDFGIALARDRISKTTTGTVKGKLAYMAPEQAGGSETDARADLFSTGAVLYELLGGTTPFHGSTDLDILRAIADGVIEPLARRRPSLPPELVAVVEKAIAVVPEQRWQDAGSMRVALEPFAMRPSLAEAELRGRVLRARETLALRNQQGRAFEDALLGGAFVAPTADTELQRPRPLGGRRWLLPGLLLVVGVGAWLVHTSQAETENSGVAAVASMDGGVELALEVADAAGSSASLAPDAAAARPDAAASRSGSENTPSKRKVVGFGAVTITSFPWAEVKIDGRSVGNTPISKRRLRAGRHEIILTNPKIGKTVRRRVRIRPNRTTELRINL